MNVKLYKNTDETKMINKTLNDETAITVSATLLDTVDVSTPEMYVDYNSSLLDYNYAYIADFNRYYFVRPPEILNGQRMLLKLYVDVLVSGKTAINNADATVIRSNTITDIPDNQYPISQEYWTESYFSQDIAGKAINTEQYAMIVT